MVIRRGPLVNAWHFGKQFSGYFKHRKVTVNDEKGEIKGMARKRKRGAARENAPRDRRMRCK